MTHRHLLPDEIDQLLDGEVGFGVAPLQAHVRECAQCQAALADGQIIVDALEQLPRFAPAPGFATRVMAQVEVYEPWHVAARDAVATTLAPLAPRSKPVRVLIGSSAVAVLALVTVGSLWLAGHLDAVVFFGAVFRARALQTLASIGSAVTSALVGRPTGDAVVRGSIAVLAATMLLYGLAVLVAVFAVRAAATARRRH
jgi:hypothetical protein